MTMKRLEPESKNVPPMLDLTSLPNDLTGAVKYAAASDEDMVKLAEMRSGTDPWKARGETPRLSSASRPLDWIYIADVVTGLLLMATQENLAGRTIDLGTGTTHTARQAVEKIVKLMGSPIVPAFGALDDRALEQRRAADVAATRALLGWAPATSFESGLQQTIDWYRREEH